MNDKKAFVAEYIDKTLIPQISVVVDLGSNTFIKKTLIAWILQYIDYEMYQQRAIVMKIETYPVLTRSQMIAYLLGESHDKNEDT